VLGYQGWSVLRTQTAQWLDTVWFRYLGSQAKSSQPSGLISSPCSDRKMSAYKSFAYMIAAPFFVEYADSWWLTADPGSQGPALVWAFRWAFISIKFPWIGPFAGSSSIFSFFFLIWGLVTGQKVGQMRSWGAGIALPFKADNLWGRALRNSLITGDLRGMILTATVGTFTTHTHRWTVQSMGFPGLRVWRGN